MYYGDLYLQSPATNFKVKYYWSIKKTWGKKWVVYEVHTGQMFELFPTKLRAYYAASRMNGMVNDVFFFGDLLKETS